MMPFCDIDKCEQVAYTFYDAEDSSIAVCQKHDPTSPRHTRRMKFPSSPRFTKRQASKRKVKK